MTVFKRNDVFTYHHSPESSEAWQAREGSIGVILGPLYEHDFNIYKINWIVDTAPHLKQRGSHPDFDNQASLDGAVLITRLEAPDVTG